MNINPFRDLPCCDICGAVVDSLVMVPASKGDRVEARFQLSCGAIWRGSYAADFNQPEPHRALAPYRPGVIVLKESEACPRAAAVLRAQRDAKNGGP
jgi:hypothetical protein